MENGLFINDMCKLLAATQLPSLSFIEFCDTSTALKSSNSSIFSKN